MPESNSSPDGAAPHRRLSDALRRLAAQTAAERCERVVKILGEAARPTAGLAAALRSVNPSLGYAEIVGDLVDAWRGLPECSGSALALGFTVAFSERSRERESAEIVWTGPASEIVAARQTSAVLFELVGQATKDITLFSFAAYNVAGLAVALQAATQRGVRVRLILETHADSGGKLSFDASAALRSLSDAAEFYVWPADRRLPGAVMHGKALLVDGRVAFITSANLTEYGIDRNLELGLVVRGGDVPRALREHVERLIEQGELKRVS